ncbi:MAG: polyribonucleotide nucleotidyltransferase, partial [Proteobacteria bacterium]|nr:polyribonucleotide nucleotidyltransferase [Pseudomonadota bacterium]
MKKVTIDFCGRPLSIETGRMAKQANGSVYIQYGESSLLTAVVAAPTAKEGQPFFPLSVDYQEKFAANGRIPGGFFKREGKQSEREVLISRLADRPIRPLFPETYMNETQITTTVFSFDKENETDVLSVLGASAALYISNVPFTTPVGAVTVGMIDGQMVCNPTISQMAESTLDLTVAATRDALVMVEGATNELSEKQVLEALQFAFKNIQTLIDLQEELKKQVGEVKKMEVPAAKEKGADEQKAVAMLDAPFTSTMSINNKIQRRAKLWEIQKEVETKLTAENAEFPKGLVAKVADELFYNKARQGISDRQLRPDGRKLNEIRNISIDVGLLPRTHGSALFTRGETQALVTTTLGTSDDEQMIDLMMGQSDRHFMLHYNFPAYSVGEVKPNRGPGRREQGHGALAHRAITPMLPEKTEFPYTLRVVSDVLESHGSSSMATVCGATLSMMDAGVPLKAPVAGIAMGLIKQDGKFFVLSDISGDEDHIGDMDFKVTGTKNGITALQMDIKVDGLSWDIVEKALEQAKEGRLHILGKMDEAIRSPRTELSKHAPRLETIQVKKDKIREVIGTGGKVIRGIIEATGAKIDINDDGIVTIASSDGEALEKAKAMVLAIVEEAEIGKIYTGKAVRVTEYGAFVNILPGKDGLLHVSEMDGKGERINDVEAFMPEGTEVTVKVLDVDRMGKIRLTQDLDKEPAPAEERPRRDRNDRGGSR